MELLSDARDAISGEDVGRLVFGVIVVIAAIVAAKLRKPGSMETAQAFRLRNRLQIGVSLAVLCFGLAPFMAAARARLDFVTGRAVVVEGCARDYRRVVHDEDHGVTDTYVRVSDQPLHFNSGVFFHGYRDEDDGVREGQALRVWTVRGQLRRLERLTEVCPTG